MRVGDRGLVSVPTSLSAGLSVGPRGPRDASGEICSQRRTKCVKRTWVSMAAAAHRVTVAVGALECPFGPSWHRKKGPPPRKCALRRDGARVQFSSSYAKYELAYPDFGFGTLCTRGCLSTNFFLEREDRIVPTTPSSVRIVSTRIRKFIFCVGKGNKMRLLSATSDRPQ